MPRRHKGLVDHIPVLRDGHFGIAVRHATNSGGKAALAVREHFIVRHQLDAAKLYAVKHIAGGVGIADPQQALQRADIALQPVLWVSQCRRCWSYCIEEMLRSRRARLRPLRKLR